MSRIGNYKKLDSLQDLNFIEEEDLIYKVIQQAVKKINEKTNDLIVEGLKLKGFVFEEKEDLIEFIKNHCTLMNYEEIGRQVLSIGKNPFLELYFRNDLEDLKQDENLKFNYDFKYKFL